MLPIKITGGPNTNQMYRTPEEYAFIHIIIMIYGDYPFILYILFTSIEFQIIAFYSFIFCNNGKRQNLSPAFLWRDIPISMELIRTL